MVTNVRGLPSPTLVAVRSKYAGFMRFTRQQEVRPRKSRPRKDACVRSGEEVGAGFERTESRRESNRATSGRRAATAWHMQIGAEPRVVSRDADRDRGTAMIAATPPTPPGMRVRTGRFERLRS